jgi:FtsP/CotA-like multicopper oxidase with cupredoxin domain
MKNLLFCLPLLLAAGTVGAKVVEYNLEIAEQPWSPGGMRAVPALTVNGGIPGPVLRFREGDTARIHVHNALNHGETTSVHWHGLLVPNQEDGVPGVTTPLIHPGETYTYEFPLKQSGTYWYHSHTGLQEQRGVYGAIVIEPKNGAAEKADRDEVVVLSDWTRESPQEVMRTLMRGSDWYSLKKGTAQSLTGAIRAGALKDFWERERSRMPPMDLSDVAYDAFLANGKRTLELPGRPGERIRLRVIDASASTYFYLDSAMGPLRVVAADGPAVKPLPVKRLLMGMAETYDVIVTVPKSGKWEVRATAQDGSGQASIWIGSGQEHPAPDIPKPDIYHMDSMMGGMDMSADMPVDMKGMDMSHMNMDDQERPMAPYEKLHAVHSTAFSAKAPRRTMKLRLTGDMERYIWSFNGKTLKEDGVIPIHRGEVLRLTLVNETMMHHPIHLHGHFFRVLDGERDDSPLKHTVDVPPMGKRTIEFEADAQGDWLFHCHLLYHMHTGMARIFSYDNQGPGHVVNLGEHAEDPFHLMVDGSLETQMTMGMATLMNSRSDLYTEWDAGFRKMKDYEVDLGWKRYFDPNFSTVAGWRFTDMEDEKNRAFAGVEYRLPYLIETRVEIDSEGGLRLEAGKELKLTDRLGIFGHLQYDTANQWEWRAGADYVLTKQFSLISEYHSDRGFGAGFEFHF